jgi:hypothetical protein
MSFEPGTLAIRLKAVNELADFAPGRLSTDCEDTVSPGPAHARVFEPTAIPPLPRSYPPES